jgi:hypothetical protein
MRTNDLIFTGASDDLSMPATLVAILNLLPWIAALFLSEVRAKRAVFFFINLVVAQSAFNLITPLIKSSRGEDR